MRADLALSEQAEDRREIQRIVSDKARQLMHIKRTAEK
jgi:hypothetical protein